MELPDDLLKNAANLRDTVIFLASVVYFIGYITWSFYSNYRKLGTVKALDAQYFAIGLPVASSIILVIPATLKLVMWINSWYQYLLSLDAQFITTIVRVLFGLVIAIVFFATGVKITLYKYILYAIALFMVLLIPETGSFFSQWTTNFYTILLTLLNFGIVVVLYVTKGYELIPHNLGGGRVRTARFDLIKNAMSPALLKELVINQVDSTIVQSRDVTVVSISDNWIVIRIGKIQDIDMPIIEIPRSSIASIVWLRN